MMTGWGHGLGQPVVLEQHSRATSSVLAVVDRDARAIEVERPFLKPQRPVGYKSHQR